MFDVDKSGDISPEDISTFYEQWKQYKAVTTENPSAQIADFNKDRAASMIKCFDFTKHKAITPDQFFNIIMASYE